MKIRKENFETVRYISGINGIPEYAHSSDRIHSHRINYGGENKNQVTITFQKITTNMAWFHTNQWERDKLAKTKIEKKFNRFHGAENLLTLKRGEYRVRIKLDKE